MNNSNSEYNYKKYVNTCGNFLKEFLPPSPPQKMIEGWVMPPHQLVLLTVVQILNTSISQGMLTACAINSNGYRTVGNFHKF